MKIRPLGSGVRIVGGQVSMYPDLGEALACDIKQGLWSMFLSSCSIWPTVAICSKRRADVGTDLKFPSLLFRAVLVGCCGAKVVCLDLFVL